MRFKSDGDKWATVNALRVAAQMYLQDAQDVEPMGQPRLVQQFKRQAETVLRIADEIEEAA